MAICWLQLHTVLSIMAQLQIIAMQTATGLITSQVPIINDAINCSLHFVILFLILQSLRIKSLLSCYFTCCKCPFNSNQVKLLSVLLSLYFVVGPITEKLLAHIAAELNQNAKFSMFFFFFFQCRLLNQVKSLIVDASAQQNNSSFENNTFEIPKVLEQAVGSAVIQTEYMSCNKHTVTVVGKLRNDLNFKLPYL